MKIRVHKRSYDPVKLNKDMETIRYNTNLDEKENYEVWLNKAQDFLGTYTKEIWVNSKKRNKEIGHILRSLNIKSTLSWCANGFKFRPFPVADSNAI